MKTFVQINQKGIITLPSEIRKKLHLMVGDLLAVILEKDRITLIPKAAIDKDQIWFWTKEWQKGELEAEEDIRKGKTKKFKSMKDLMKDLHS